MGWLVSVVRFLSFMRQLGPLMVMTSQWCRKPVEDGGGQDGVGEDRAPFNWNWLKFPIAVLPFDMLVLVSGVSA